MDLFTLGLLQKNLSGNKGDIKSKNGESSYTITDAVDFPVLGLNLYGKSVQDGTPTPETPVDIVSVGDDGELKVTACGKNLFPWNDYTKIPSAWFQVESGEQTTNEIKFVSMKDTVSVFPIPSPHIKGIMSSYNGQTVTISAEIKSDAQAHMTFGLQSNFKRFLSTNNWQKISHTLNYSNADLFDATLIIGTEGEATTIYARNISIELGDTATEYEPYTGSNAAITSALPLCGIPVESGGNYTDSNGQQWICDELVYNADGTGKIIKKTAKIIFNGSENWDKSGITEIDRYILRNISTIKGVRITTGLCNAYIVDVSETHSTELGKILLYPTYYDQISVNFAEYGTSTVETFKDYLKNNPIVLCTDLIEPQEIPLSAAEMAALRQLMTYSGTTNISNSDNAEMDVKYCINQVMADYYPIFAGQGADVQPLVLFQGTDEGYSLADGFTGFSAYYTDTYAGAVANISQNIDSTTESQYGCLIGKSWGISISNANYTDSAVISSNKKIDLTKYNSLCIDFYGYCDYNITDMNTANKMSAYFKIDRPETLPQSKNAYDWTDWDDMCMNYKKHGKYYFDISQITGEHYLCFGIFHGDYAINNTNGIKIYKMTLI